MFEAFTQTCLILITDKEGQMLMGSSGLVPIKYNVAQPSRQTMVKYIHGCVYETSVDIN